MRIKAKELTATILCYSTLFFPDITFADKRAQMVQVESRFLEVQDNTFYGKFEGGISFSSKAGIHAPFTFWDPTPSGYNSRLCCSEVFGLGFGFMFNPWMSAELMVDHRNSFKYRKMQRFDTGDITRVFNFQNTTLLGNLIFYGGEMFDNLMISQEPFSIQPIVGLGVGASFNTIRNFHSKDNATDEKFSEMRSHTQVSLAVQPMVGLEGTVNLNITPTINELFVGTGVRFLDGGRIKTNNKLIDNPDNFVMVDPWTGKFRTTELFVFVKVPFN